MKATKIINAVCSVGGAVAAAGAGICLAGIGYCAHKLGKGVDNILKKAVQDIDFSKVNETKEEEVKED